LLEPVAWSTNHGRASAVIIEPMPEMTSSPRRSRNPVVPRNPCVLAEAEAGIDFYDGTPDRFRAQPPRLCVHVR
jgi:hypothetical protein